MDDFNKTLFRSRAEFAHGVWVFIVCAFVLHEQTRFTYARVKLRMQVQCLAKIENNIPSRARQYNKVGLKLIDFCVTYVYFVIFIILRREYLPYTDIDPHYHGTLGYHGCCAVLLGLTSLFSTRR